MVPALAAASWRELSHGIGGPSATAPSAPAAQRRPQLPSCPAAGPVSRTPPAGPASCHGLLLAFAAALDERRPSICTNSASSVTDGARPHTCLSCSE